MNNQQSNNTVPDTSILTSKKIPNEMNRQHQKMEKKNTQPNNTQSKNPEQAIIQGQKVNLEHLKRVVDNENTTLLLLRNREWRIVKTEMNKIKQAQTDIY